MDDPEIAIAQDQHVQALCDMIRIASEADVQGGYPPAWLSSADQNVKKAVAEQHMRLITVEGVLAGCFSIELADEVLWGAPVDAAWYLHCLTVDTAVQGRGLGRRAVEHVEQTAASSGIEFVRLDVPTVRDITGNWYRKMGYVERGVVQPPSYRRPAMLYEKIVASHESQ